MFGGILPHNQLSGNLFTASDQQCIHSRWWLASNRTTAAAVVTLRSSRWSTLTQWHRAWRAIDLQLKVFQCNRPRDMHRLTSLFIDAFFQIQISFLNQIYKIRGICVVDFELYRHTHKHLYICVHRIYHYIIRTYFHAISNIFKGLLLF